MSVHLISALEAMARYDRFDAVIDARSEGEHAEDHLPGAVNWPSLDNEERIRVGTLYKQVSPFEAQKSGAALVAEATGRADLDPVDYAAPDAGVLARLVAGARAERAEPAPEPLYLRAPDARLPAA